MPVAYGYSDLRPIATVSVHSYIILINIFKIELELLFSQSTIDILRMKGVEVKLHTMDGGVHSNS
jgi:hypothetical protein